MNMSVSQTGLLLAEYDDPEALIYGIGNIGRQDDGLGWAFIDWLETTSICPRAELVRSYQLQMEDADLISRKKRVLFVDATREAGIESFQIQRMHPRLDFSFTSHAISIPAIMATCEQCFQQLPEVQLLAIRGYEWELAEGLSPLASKNLKAAVSIL